MRQEIPFNLEERVMAALTDSRLDLWFPQLTYELAQTGWRRLKADIELDKFNYGTARVILKDAGASRDVLYTLLFKNTADEVKETVLVEALPEFIKDHYKKSGVAFYNLENFLAQSSNQNEILDCLNEAFKIIRQVPDLFETVVDLVRCIHLIKPESDEYDISFSEPHIPFSIFVSIPQKNNTINALRVAEAIVHEAMHLQLTLIEALIPLVTNSDEKFYSPWRGELRNAAGILHAIYVFQVLQSFFSNLLNLGLFLSPETHYLNERSNLIAHQIAEVKIFADYPDLTHLGRDFIDRLI
jgi:hypothetical protein